MKNILLAVATLWFMQSCNETAKPAITAAETTINATEKTPDSLDINAPVADAATILSRKQVPVLCYHHIKDWKPNERSSMKEYIVPVANFKAQMKYLADSGYHTITGDQYYAYLTKGTPLPPKPVMLTFDDTDEEQYTIGATEMAKYGFKGVYFIMTISIGRPRYMSKEQLKALADSGHTVAAHTWDHHNVKNYGEADWDVQFAKPKEKIESITGKPVEYFAYPFGVWKKEAIPELEKRGYKAAFQLSANVRDTAAPLYTLRRMIVPGTWDTKAMQKWMNYTFK